MKVTWVGPMLKVNNLNVYYGDSQILKNISMTVEQGQLVVMLGPNGHGKSTLLKSICGLVEKVKGLISYAGKEINGLETDKIVNLGVVQEKQLKNQLQNLKIFLSTHGMRC